LTGNAKRCGDRNAGNPKKESVSSILIPDCLNDLRRRATNVVAEIMSFCANVGHEGFTGGFYF
jgi:hypothetical protein